MPRNEVTPGSGAESTSAQQEKDLKRIAGFLGGVAVVGTVALLLWASTSTNWSVFGSKLGAGSLIAGSASLVGGLLGLLFGIPKSISDPAAVRAPEPPTPPSHAEATAVSHQQTADAQDVPARSKYAANTGLEQVSDWLTKIIVGVGLTQLATIKDYLLRTAQYFGNAFPEPGTHPEAASAILISYGVTGGFFAGYLLTRIFLPGVFDRAEELQRQLFRSQRLLQTREQEAHELGLAIEEVRSAEGEISTNLYRYNEQGFTQAIEDCERLLKTPGQERNPRLWVYLACAHGQAWRWQKENPLADEGEQNRLLAKHRAAALEAVQKALEYGPTWKPTLQMAWDPSFPGKPSEEDDLECFYTNDPNDAFYGLLHR